MAFSCQPEKDCDYNRKFTIPVTIEPFSSHYNVGDTINLRVEIPQDIYDSTRGEFVDVREWQYGTQISFQEFVGTKLISASHHFEYSLEFGVSKLETDLWSISCFFNVTDSERIHEGKIVFRESGSYLFSFFNWNTQITLKDCPNRRILLHYQLNDDLEKNYELIEDESLKEEINYEELIEYGGYIFVVDP